ncbi:GNAT family N-acetyltransferase [Henriciella marina]|uniref:GNAT family N-acetyltransferase n=1 Tax=Henriciella marina TaxID=453851 RepID=UPI000373CE4B|nr:GNAT family N-acetyltransferase [Henriciella marina]
MEQSVLIRPACLQDVSAIIAADIAASALFKPTGLLSDDALNDHVEASDVETAVDAGVIDVAEVVANNRVAGFIQYGLIEGDLYLEQVSVDPAYGRQGIGRQLMSWLDQRAIDLGAPRVTLSTFRDLAWNGPFYASLGFEEIPRGDMLDYMFRIEAAQAPLMDVSKRFFMIKTVRN